MPDPIFAHPRLAPIYDAFNSVRDDLAAYVAIAGELGADTVLDVGCGTGCLAVLLARTGRTVIAADPAGASLEVARSKDPARKITWVHADAAGLPSAAPVLARPAGGADLALMTGNAAQVFRTDDDWGQALTGIRAVLRPGAHLVFETRRPERRGWADWPADVTLDVPGAGLVRQRLKVTWVRLPLVSFRYSYTFLADGTVITSDSTLRFRDEDELARSLAAHGYRVLDVRQAPDRPGREFVFVAQRVM